MTREEHLQWAKDRALEYVEMNELGHAWASFTSDMRKHDELTTHPALILGSQLLASGHLSSQGEMEKFIKDFN